MAALQTISESVYVGLCLKIGTPELVTMRRDFVDMEELLKKAKTDNMETMLSGSRREGFRLKGSDVDFMCWFKNHRVIWDFSQATLYNTHRYALILCDSSESPPGFTLLWLPLAVAGRLTLSSSIRINGALYISSAMYRDNTCTLLTPDFTVHGPCSSGKIGVEERDNAHCFVSEFWPPSASSWINRCHSWPPPHVVNDIIRSGCHFVAIGHKLGKHADNEWRISFSKAEQKLVYSMNHTQFLVYGLLKLFVKEFNHGFHEEEKLLCSYHMKTTIFWAIQQSAIPKWCPQNLLVGFWVSLNSSFSGYMKESVLTSLFQKTICF
ncbi:cyclic GMP-AMP synthase-like receptor 2 [Crassostrea virginica]